MVIVQLLGGLGNQMFQYAFGRSLSNRFNTELKLDISLLNNSKDEVITKRLFELSNFNICSEIVTEDEIQIFSHSNNLFYNTLVWLKNITQGESIFGKIIFKTVKSILPFQVITETPCIKRPIRKKRHNYIIGYWQDEDYFIEIENVIRNEFSFKKPPSGANIDYLNVINGSNSVGVHIRKGDYISITENQKIFNNIEIDYYIKAETIIREKLENPHFFIFTDDIKWARDNYPIKDHFLISHNKNNPIEDLRLFSACKHQIIANSSFSWWGAWLNQNTSKIIVAPKIWFIDSKNKNAKIVPKGWIRI
jgi:hypothetical protein